MKRMLGIAMVLGLMGVLTMMIVRNKLHLIFNCITI